ncbi:tetratricopeptide repeat protein [Flavobacterium sp. LB1P71]|uniref:tetratricopeptide repeat protein n=1 Tax=unclassified Flavobacterium TaxID=196869 RepID=UPI003AACBABD
MKKIIYFLALSFLIHSCKKNGENAIYNTNEKPREVILLGNEKHIKNRKALSLFETGLKKINTKEYESAKDFFIKADKIEPNNIVILDCLANIESAIGNNKKSTEMLYNNISKDSTFVNSYLNLGANLMNEKKYQEAKKILLIGLEKCKKINLHQKSSLLLNLAISCNNLNECDNGLKYAQQALKISQNDNFTVFAEKIISENNQLRENNNCH